MLNNTNQIFSGTNILSFSNLKYFGTCTLHYIYAAKHMPIQLNKFRHHPQFSFQISIKSLLRRNV